MADYNNKGHKNRPYIGNFEKNTNGGNFSANGDLNHEYNYPFSDTASNQQKSGPSSAKNGKFWPIQSESVIPSHFPFIH
jgi:hypothetical protein